MNLKVDKWSKLIGNDDQKNLIVDWLEKKHIVKLVFYLTPAGQLTADYEAPPSSKTKVIALYGVKASSGNQNLTGDDFTSLRNLRFHGKSNN